jgi:hypothetical protein
MYKTFSHAKGKKILAEARFTMELFSYLIVLNVKFGQRIKKKNFELSNRKTFGITRGVILNGKTLIRFYVSSDDGVGFYGVLC